MALWKRLYETADAELKAVLEESNFNICTEMAGKNDLHKGYRIDLIYEVDNALSHATSMMKTYQELGYKNCKTLSPDEVLALDPSLAGFCSRHSTGEPRHRLWKGDSIALWRPGGCLDTQVFLPKLAGYLEKIMGTYANKKREKKDCFQIKFNKKVTGIIFEPQSTDYVIKGLMFADGTQTRQKTDDKNVIYAFSPGEAVGTLAGLGCSEPAYAGFAGASLSLTLPLSGQRLEEFQGFSHCMEVHRPGVVLAWQARIKDGNLFLGGAGTKSYYGDCEPKVSEAFATNRNLLQLNMFNDVLPQVVSLALGRDTAGQQLIEQDMEILTERKIANRWVGRRSVTFDGFPTLGYLYHKGKKVSNATCATHAGSGGGSFSLILALLSQSIMDADAKKEAEGLLGKAFVQEALGYGDSRRKAS